jgi:anti-sigma factor ChrR (cupin superfamily)
MSIHPSEAAINDYADGTADPFERHTVEQHVASCAACRQLVDDLREIARATAALELRDPPVRVWGRIERAIKLERDADADRGIVAQGPLQDGARRLQPGGPAKAGHYLRWIAAAAALVLATVIGLRFMPGRGPGGAEPVDVQTGYSDSGTAQAVESELRLAETHYEKAITGLEQIAKSDQGSLDPNTAATLQKNLAVIDQAISESRAAVRAQPTSEPAQQSLIENFKSKIGLLQDTVALINEMRKGNEAGAARIVSGLKQKG